MINTKSEQRFPLGGRQGERVRQEGTGKAKGTGAL